MRRLLPILVTVAVLSGSASASASDHCEDSSNPRYTQSECYEGPRDQALRSSSGDLQKGKDAYRRRDFKTAHNILKRLAEQGDVDAQLFLGGMYRRGGRSSALQTTFDYSSSQKHVSQDYNSALKWYQLAAKQGNADAQYWVGWIYDLGLGVSQNYKIALRWYRLAAKQGNADAGDKVKYLAERIARQKPSPTATAEKTSTPSTRDYQKGLNAFKRYDFATAQRHLEPIAEQGHARAQFRLGVMYDNGWGVPQNYKFALKWYNLAAEQGHSRAQDNLKRLQKKIAQQKPSPTVTAEKTPTPSSGEYWQGRLAYQRQDYATALNILDPLAEQGDADSQFLLGLMYQYGEGITQDYETAVKWYRRAAKQGYTRAENHLEILENRIAEQKPSPTVTAEKPKPKVDQQKLLILARRTQEALQVLRLYSGKLDGIIGVKTRSAIQQWQKRNGYPGTGEVTEAQLAKLEQKAITRLAEKKSEPTKPSATTVPKRPDDVAVIIANSNYTKQGKGIPNVDPAYNDAKNIKKYFMESLGVREGNIIYLKDATGTQMTSVFGSHLDHRGRLFNWTKPNISKVYVYYAGHGAPAGDRGTTYLVPSDTDSQTVQLTGYPLKQLYKNLGKLPATSITVILEACFSGQSHSGHLSVRTSGISIQPKMPNVPDKLTVISAGAANQVASWEQDESQSLFTKYFLKAMSGDGDRKPYGNGDGKVSLKELKRYLDKEMTYLARRYYGRDQNAQITVDGRQVHVTN